MESIPHIHLLQSRLRSLQVAMASLSDAWSAAEPEQLKSEALSLPQPPAPLKSRASAPLRRLKSAMMSGTFKRQPEDETHRQQYVNDMQAAGWEVGLAEWLWSASEVEGARVPQAQIHFLLVLIRISRFHARLFFPCWKRGPVADVMCGQRIEIDAA